MPTNYNPDTDALETRQERFAREAEVDERIMRGEHEKAAKTEHTPEPLSVFTVYAHPEIRDANGEFVASLGAGDVITARRIVACVNACAGLTTAELELAAAFGERLQAKLVGAKYKQQRDELLAAAEAIEINAEECLDFDECTAMLIQIDDYHRLMEAIASVKGGAA